MSKKTEAQQDRQDKVDTAAQEGVEQEFLKEQAEKPASSKDKQEYQMTSQSTALLTEEEFRKLKLLV